jgi:two-component system, cell cycle sensor histidine kinase and response regulator CckA
VQPHQTSSEVPAPRAGSTGHWSVQQLTGFLAMVSSAEDERTASRVAVERAVEALGADIGVLFRAGTIVASAGMSRDPMLEAALADVADGHTARLMAPGVGERPALAITVEPETPSRLVFTRAGDVDFTPEEIYLARGMAHVLSLSLRLFRLAAEERRQRREAETQSELNQRLLDSLQERQELLERLARIQRSITHGATREDVLDAICLGARELLGDEVAALQLIPPDDPDVLELVAMRGRDALELHGMRLGRGHGIAWRAMAEERLVVSEDYMGEKDGAELFRERGIRSGMAAPVHESGRPVGSLVVASYDSGRRYSSIERDMLLAFADHASLALSDARTIQALREADAARIQARFRSLVNSSSDMITVIDSGGQIVFASPSVERALVLPEAGYEGTPLELLIHPEDRSRAIDFIAAVARENAPGKPVEWRMRAADGTWIDVETTATGQLDDPDVQGIVLNSRDVTERKRLEAQLRQSQRLESVGQLAGGIAHDFNNFLSVIRGYARFLTEAMDEEEPLRSDALEIEKAAERASRLTSQLLVFSRAEVVQRRVVDLAEVLGGLTSLLARTLGENVSFQTDVERPLLRVEADPTQMEQVLVNLVVNARDAMPAGGELRIELGNAPSALGGGDAVRLRVRDTGDGMTPDVVERAFEPFYTTKAKGEGTGLGLATVYGIVTQTGGTVEIQSAPGAGTTIEVLLPATDAELPTRPGSDNGARGSERGETILVVEDEDAVRRLTCRILSREGYIVLQAPDGHSALTTWDEHPGEIDLLLTDVVMPGMSGRELAERLGIEPVFMSGYTDDVISRHGMEGLRLVQKPFDAQTLLGAVRSALDA